IGVIEPEGGEDSIRNLLGGTVSQRICRTGVFRIPKVKNDDLWLSREPFDCALDFIDEFRIPLPIHEDHASAMKQIPSDPWNDDAFRLSPACRAQDLDMPGSDFVRQVQLHPVGSLPDIDPFALMREWKEKSRAYGKLFCLFYDVPGRRSAECGQQN